MGVLRQFGALLWKNYIIRKRKPVFLLLEVLWPIIIFVAIALIRRGIPPEPRESCHYEERALPSSGMLPFLQSSACTLHNPCHHSPVDERARASAQERLRSMLYKVEPHIMKDTTLTAFEALPTIAKVFNTLKDKLNDTVLEELDDRLILKNLLRDHEKIIELLVDKYKLMTDQQARDLLDASLNPFELIKALSSVNFKEVACDETQLGKYIFFQKNTDVAAVSRSLCAIDDKLISNITNEVVRQIDIANLIRFAEEFANFVGEFDFAVLLGDLADLAEVYLDQSGLLDAISDLPDLSMIPAVLDKLAVIIPAFEDLRTVDMESISALYELMDPLIETLVKDESTLGIIRSTFKSFEEWDAPFEASEIDWKQLINVTASFTEALNSVGNLSMDINGVLNAMELTDFNDMYEWVESLFSNKSMEEILPNALTKMSEAYMEGLGQVMGGILSNTTVNMMMTVAYEVIEMGMDILETYQDIDRELRQFVMEEYGNTSVMTILVQWRPEKASSFLTAVLKMSNFEQLMKGEMDPKSLCVSVANDVFEKEQDAAEVISTLCSDEIMNGFSNLINSSGYHVMLHKMDETMSYISSVIDDPESQEDFVDMKTVYAKMSEMMNHTTAYLAERTREWTELLSDLPYALRDGNDEYSWYLAWTNASSTIFMSSIMVSGKQIGESMEGTELWEYAMPYAVSSEAYWASVAEPYRVMEDMKDVTTPVGMMVENMEYIPDVVPAMLNFMNSETGQREMEIFYQDPIKAICEEDFLLNLEMPDTVPMDSIKQTVCDMDWIEYGENILESMDWMGSLQKKIDIQNYNGTTATVDWDRMMDNVNLYMTMMNQPEKLWKDVEYVMNKMNFTKLLENLGKMDQSVPELNFTGKENTMNSVASMMDSIDQALGNMSFWNYGKHIAKAWMAYTNIAYDIYVHTRGSVDVTEYMKTISPTLGEYYMNISTMFPTLFDDLTKSLQNPQTILSAMLNTEWDNFCNGTKLNEILHLKETEQLKEFEQGLCELNWTAIMEELVEYNPNIKIYSDELMILAGDLDKVPSIAINWTELVEGTLSFVENTQTLYTSSNTTGIEGIDTNSLNATLGDFISTLTKIDQWDMTRYGAIVDEMMKLLNGQGGHDGNETWADILAQTNMLQNYIQYHFLVFGNHILHYINTTNPVDIKKYLNSEEANKVIRVSEVSTQVNAALMSNLKDFTRNPQKITDLFSSNLSDICENEQSFGKLFTVPADSNLTLRDLQDTVCGVNLNVTKLVTELERSVPGFKTFLKAMSYLENRTAVESENINVTQIVIENERFTRLLTAIIENPPNITLFWSDPEKDMELLLKQLEDFANFSASGFGDQQITSTFATIQQHLGEALSGFASSSPEISKLMYIADAYLQTIENSVIREQTGLWEDPSVSLSQYPEMFKVWKLMEQIPEVYETFQYTLTHSNTKISTFISKVSEGFEQLCDADPATLMTVPPSSNFSFSQFMTDLCNINMTALETESNDYYGGQLIMDAYASIDNITEPTNITAMFQRMDTLYNTIVGMSNNSSPEADMKLPRFLDTKIWEEIFSESSDVLANSTIASSDGTSVIDQIMDSIDQLQQSMPDIRPFLNTVMVYLAVMERSAEQQLVFVKDPVNAFIDYPEMRKMWLLLDDLPELYQTYSYTSMMAPNKLSNFTATLTSGIENLCDANPSDLMTVPPDLDFDFADFHQKFCAINLTKLAEESMDFNGQANITHALISFSNLTNLVNINEMGRRIDQLTKSMSEFFNVTTSANSELPRFLNASLWLNVMETVNEWITDPDIYSQVPHLVQVFQPFMSKDMEKIAAAVDVMMDVFIDRLQGYTGEVTKDYLLNNNTELRVILDALNALSHNGAADLIDGTIDVAKLVSLVVEPETKLKEACDDKTFTTLISKNGSVSETARNIEKVMCMDVEAVLEALMDLSEVSSVQDKLTRIFNGSEEISLDWKAMGAKAETLIKIMTDQVIKEPTADNELSEFFNIENMLSLLQSLVMNPNIIGQMTTAFMPAVDQNILDIMDPVIGGLADLLTQLQEKNITAQTLMTDPAMLSKLLQSLNTFETQLSSYTKNFIKPAIEQASKHSSVQTAVCDYPLLKETAKTVPHMDVDLYKVLSTLCGKDSSTWFDQLIEANFTQTELIGVKNILEAFYTPTGDDTTRGSWSNLINSMSNLVEGYIQFFNVSYTAMTDSAAEPSVDVNSIMNGTIHSFISYMKIMESELSLGESLQGVKQFFNTMINIQKYLNEQLEKGKDGNSGIDFEKLLPDAESLAKIITGLQGEEMTAVITLMNIDPEAFLNISLHGMWEEVSCDVTKFYKEFSFPEGFDSEGMRKTLCEAARSDSSTFNTMLDYVEMSDLLKQLSDWMNNDGTTSVGSNVWSELWQQSEQFLKNVLELQNIDLDKLTSYGETLLKHMGEISNPSVDSYTATCERTIEQFSGNSFYGDTMLPILNMVDQQTQIQYLYLELYNEMMDVMCLEPASNFTRFVDLLKMTTVPEKMKSIADLMTSGTTFSCQRMVDVSTKYSEAMNRSFAIWMDMEKFSKCMEGQLEMMLEMFGDVTKLFEASKVMLREVRDEDFQYVIKTIAGNDEILKVVEYMLQGFMQQQNWLEEANKKIQSNITKLEDYIEDTFSLSPNVVQSLLNATFSKDLANYTAEELVNSLCSDSLSEPADEILSFFNSSLRNLIGIDCDKDWNTTYDIVNSLLTLSKLANQLQGNIALDSVEWWMGLSKDLAELATSIQGLTDLAGVLNNLNDIDVTSIAKNGELLVTIQRLLVDSGPDSLIDSLNRVLDKFGELNDDTQVVFEDLQIMTKGLLSFTTLRKLIITNVRIKDLLKEPDEFQQYLVDNIGIKSEVAEAIVDGTLSFELLINASQANLTDWVCEPAMLADILKLNSSSLDYTFISETFCGLNASTIAKILDEVFVQLDIGDLVEEFINANIDEILADSGVSMNETQAALDSLQDANEDLKEVMEIFDDYSANLTNVIATLAQSQIGTSSSQALSALLCGDEVDTIGDEFNLGRSLPKVESFTETQKKELEELRAKSPVCEQMYMDIMSVGGGAIIWGYLKPVIRGKILYSPDNDITRAIIAKVNSTFETIENFQHEIERLKSGATSLENITSGDADLANLLDSPLVVGFLSQFSGSSNKGFEDLAYTLNDTDSDLVKAMSSAASFMGDYVHCIELDRFVGYDSELDLEWEAGKLMGSNSLFAGVVFTNVPEEKGRKKRQAASEIPHHLKYKIRLDIDNVETTQRIKDRMWRPLARDHFAQDLRYLRGFIQLQDMIDSAIIESMTGTEGTKFVASTKQIPYPCHKRDTFLNAVVAYLLPVMVTFAWLAGLALATYNLVLDREDGQEETLRAMGLVCCLNWWAWFLFTMLGMAVVSILVTIIAHYSELLPYTNFAIIFLYFLDFCFSTTMLCYFVSAFFTRTSIAILVTMIVYFLSYIPYIVLLTLDIQMTHWQKSLACLSSTSAFGFAAQYMAWFEEQQIGIQWSNIADSAIRGDEASFSWCCIMMVIDGAIYLVLGWYVRNVKPADAFNGKYGVSEPWYFIVHPSYWCSCLGLTSDTKDRYRTAEQGENFQEETSSTPKVVSVRGLSKEYKRGKPVVSDLNMDVYAGQVTTVLGHNGAAKTTTMNMLTGILEPTAGHVKIFNQPLKNMKESIGICPQHNALYKYMSVKEHMEFVQSVKNNSSGLNPKEEIRQILEEVNLWHCRHCSIQELSGGMQRRLCVALAFVGGSRAVILDEPTSGVDPSGRRAIWNLIIRKKADTNSKAIGVLLSTHHLDEAEVISDKVCILHEGKLLCSGSPLYLKEKFSSGHRVTVERDTTTGDHGHSAITMCIQHFVPSAVLQSSVGNEMTFVLPTSDHKNFYDMFRALEEKQEELHIAGFGVSDPTLEEVFLTVCQRAEKMTVNGQSRQEESQEPDASKHGQAPPTVPLPKVRYNTGLSWKLQQFFALLVKRFHHYRRNWRLFLSAILLPVLLFLAASGMYTVRPDYTQKNLLMSPAIYGPDTYFFIDDNTGGMEAAELYDTFMRNPGIATTCMNNMKELRDEYGLKCVDPATSYSVPDYTYDPNATCYCDNHKWRCDKGSPTAPPTQRLTTTGDILQDLEGRNVGNYVFESFDDFKDKRFGGYSFHDDETGSTSTDKVKTTVWFNNKGYHSLPSFYSGYSNAVLRARAQKMNSGNPEKYGISTFSHPFTFNSQQLSKETIIQSAADLGIAATIMLAFTFIPVGIVLYSVNEYINKEKHLQFTSGVGPVLYWLTTFFWDLIILALTTVLVFVVIVIFRHDAFWARNNAAGVIVLVLLYGWATLPLVYCTTKLFSTASTAFLTMFCTLNFIGLVPICAVFILNFFQGEEIVYDAYVVCQKVFLIFPTYALGEGLIEMMTNQIQTNIFARFGTDVYVDPFTFDMLGWNYVALGIEGLVFFVFAVLLDVFAYCKCESGHLELDNDRYEDDDVAEEKQRLYQRGNNDSLIARNISKVYKRAGSNFLAVDHVTFGVSPEECFGLLGINGAGKTTTFKILTGSLNATDGSAYFSPKGLQEDTTMWQNIGYCPQEEALDAFLTVREILEFYGKMRGLDSQARKIAIRNVIENLELQPILKKTVRTCSGGMKRKLSLAVALLGDPSFVLLDEPTTGMDPVAKRLAWNCIKFAKSKGQTIVLTSHSMEECDVLCSRISILVNGQMKCLGSPQHLKNKFGDTYTIMLHVCGPLARSGKIFELVHSYFPRASVRDHHLDVIQLDIPKQTTTVSEIFRVLETEKEHYNILYYTVSQNTLETVFLNFAREQHDSDTEGSSSSDRDSDLTDEESKLSSKLLPNTRLGYMNKAYEGLGDYPISPSSKYAESTKTVDPELVTMETKSGYSTNLDFSFRF